MQNHHAYPAEDRHRLREILQLWRLEILHDRLIDQFITITVLKLLRKDDVNQLISNKFPIGVKVMFTYKLQEWQKRNPLTAAEYSRLNKQYNV
ncbi:unnamed protein product [Macrosiphum euphorbiae]|uniref:Uncharacterized protein n=1 Tax=Macrosiphum euphorbiae TaxID=13131 RepID=A0AAV0XZ98_9HEMI|nr:unnamed protein product [Macrosiphum euphorbiae]CAI6373915.1 unnamed protein product [Macrosiphum euphorbiae]